MIENDKASLWLGGYDGMKKTYIELLKSTQRPNIEILIEYLEKDTDFFTAPASSQGHNNYRSGLLEHSLKTWAAIYNLAPVFMKGVGSDTLVIVSLLHDVCKTNFYKETTRNVKVDGVWQQEPYFSIEDKLPLGHGEKSVILLQRFISLSIEEVMAIRWHMGGFDDAGRQYAGGLALNGAMEKYPIITLLHMADLAAVSFEEAPLE